MNPRLRDFAHAFAVAIPPAIVAVWLAAHRDMERPLVALTVAMGVSAFLAWSGRAFLRRRLQTVASVLASYREGDFSIRARTAVGPDAPLFDVLSELNELGETLRQHRLGEMEAWALLRKVLAEIDVVVVAVDDAGKVRLANEAAARALGKSVSALVGVKCTDLGIEDLVAGEAPRIVKSAALGTGPWELRRGSFRLAGEPATLVVLSDVSSALRDNERDAWRRLIRVISHEINNSLTPIHSMSESLLARFEKDPDVAEPLRVIARRSDALGRFMSSYARLAKLPPPRMARVPLGPLVEKVALLERRVPVSVVAGPDVTVAVDADQIEQALINLVKNAADATEGGVSVSWKANERGIEIAVEDDGPGIGETANLFVPFFTTKPGGSGIGLVLAREIVDAHKGELSLESRTDARGAVARIRLPSVEVEARRASEQDADAVVADR